MTPTIETQAQHPRRKKTSKRTSRGSLKNQTPMTKMSTSQRRNESKGKEDITVSSYHDRVTSNVTKWNQESTLCRGLSDIRRKTEERITSYSGTKSPLKKTRWNQRSTIQITSSQNIDGVSAIGRQPHRSDKRKAFEALSVKYHEIESSAFEAQALGSEWMIGHTKLKDER